MGRTITLGGLLLAGLLARSVVVAEPPPADPAGPGLAGIAGQEGVFKSGPWTYEYRITGKGSRSEGTLGKLSYNTRDVFAEGINDRINTPWGIMYWYGPPKLWGPHGWMPKPVANDPEGKVIPEPNWGPQAAATSQPTSQPVELTAKANGTTTTLRPGQDLIVRLAGNPTTGFHWEITSVIGGMPPPVTPVGEVAYQAKPAPPRMTGTGGMFTAKFHAAFVGQSVITMVYRRPWEKDAAPIETFTLTVDVKE